LSGLISITRVSLSNDLKNATILVSAMGAEPDRDEILNGFHSAAGFLRRELAHRLKIRFVPELKFQFDDSIEQGVKLVNLIERVATEDKLAGRNDR
jgi:ribosome-binding factor A